LLISPNLSFARLDYGLYLRSKNLANIVVITIAFPSLVYCAISIHVAYVGSIQDLLVAEDLPPAAN